jgi:hypothetical protein
MVAQVQPAAAQTQQEIFVPLVIGEQEAEMTTPFGGTCAEGYHLVKNDGSLGVEHIEPFGVDPHEDEGDEAAPDAYQDGDYLCVADQSVEEISCGANGTAVVDGGVAACVCEAGYGGATCNLCAQGYEEGEGGACVLGTQPELVVDGATASMIPGETRIMTPTAPGISVFVFTIDPTQGCLEQIGGGCVQTVTGSSARVRASQAISEITPLRLEISRPAVGGSPPYEWEVNTFVIPSDQIPVAGYGDSRLLPVIEHLSTYMIHRCIGAATVGIARNGTTLGSWSLGRMDGPAASNLVWDEECNDPSLSIDELADPVPWDAPFLIGSNTKFHTSSILRWALKLVAEQEGDLELTDEQIMGLRPFDPDNYPPVIPDTNPPLQFPVPIVPREVYSVFAGLEPYPAATIADSASFGAVSATYPLCDGSSVADGFADAQWQDVTIAEIISHRTGMQRSAPSYGSNIVTSLPALRGLTTEQDYIDQEAILRAQWGDAAVNAGKAGLGYPGGTQSYLLPLPTIEDLMFVLAGRCLRYPLGVYSYSNTSPAFSALIIEQLVASGNFSAPTGDPAAHDASALGIFLEQSVGIATSADRGIFDVQGAVDVPGVTWRGAEFRAWSNSGNTYYPTEWDTKQPHCVWNDGNSTCSFTDWRNATNGRIRWNMTNGEVPFALSGGPYNTGTGSFAVEVRDELEVLATYRIGSYSNPISVGQPREGQPNASYSHNGSLGGGHSFVRQIAATTSENMSLPPRDNNGNLLDDYTDISTFTCSSQLPDGVDYIVSINQNIDPKCLNTPDPDDPTENVCSAAYSVLDAVIRYGICQVNWAVVPTINNFAVAE